MKSSVFRVDKNLNYGRDAIREFISSVGPIGTALDIGAGEGIDLESVLDRNPDCKVYGVEPFLEFQKMLVAKGVEPISIDIERESIPLDNKSVDLVITNQVMEHVKDIFWKLHNVSKVLKVGGHLIIGVPNLASLHNRVLLAFGRQPTSIGNHSAHIRGYTKQDMVRLFSLACPAGYELVDCRGGGFYPFGPLFAIPLAKLFPSNAVGMFLLFRKIKEYDSSFIDYPVVERLNTNFYTGQDKSSLWE